MRRLRDGEIFGAIPACLKAADACSVVEVGAEIGGMSRSLVDDAEILGGTLTSIDPASEGEPVDLAKAHGRVHTAA